MVRERDHADSVGVAAGQNLVLRIDDSDFDQFVRFRHHLQQTPGKRRIAKRFAERLRRLAIENLSHVFGSEVAHQGGATFRVDELDLHDVAEIDGGDDRDNHGL